jgi:hypothetical protein
MVVSTAHRWRYVLACGCVVLSSKGPSAATTPNIGEKVRCREHEMTVVSDWQWKVT